MLIVNAQITVPFSEFVLTYVRSSFGNSASAVTPEEVARERAATASRTTMWTVAELERAH